MIVDPAAIWQFLTRRPPAHAGPLPTQSQKILEALGDPGEAFFVQVGSNDGVQGDPIFPLVSHRPGWRGLLIEPVPALFARLQKNYRRLPSARRRFAFENLAIAEKAGTRDFFHVSDRARNALGDELPFWYDQLGSFDRDHILKHLDGRLEPFIVARKVECATLSCVLARNHVETIDLLHIDAEGYDHEVLLQLDWKRWRPRAILFEYVHLTEQTRQECVDLLKTQGYRLAIVDYDILATLPREAV